MLVLRTRQRPVRIGSARTGLRRGVSILEVLFAIMVTTIGLLGAIAVFPVASSQAHKGRVADEVAVVGQSAVHIFDARYMRRPANWIVFQQSGTGPNSESPGQARYPAQEQANGKASWFDGTQSFCIDPRFIAANYDTSKYPSLVLNVSSGSAPASVFPSGSTGGMWRVTLDADANSANGMSPMVKAMADSVFQCDDDLLYNRPTSDRTLNAIQLFDTSNGTSPTLGSSGGTVYKRFSEGRLSWMATLVPKLDRNSKDYKDTFTLSIVVFHDRPADMSASDTMHERNVSADLSVGSGIGGGEVKLSTPTSNTNGADNLKLNVNDWILLAGTTTPVAPKNISVSVFKWYRVVDMDPQVTINGTNYERYVTLVGPDWDTSTTANAALVEGVVGVYEKTIQLDLSSGY